MSHWIECMPDNAIPNIHPNPMDPVRIMEIESAKYEVKRNGVEK